jgi:hypothetical protein
MWGFYRGAMPRSGLFIENLPEKARRQVSTSVSQREEDPVRRHLQPLQGKEWKGYYPHLFEVALNRRMIGPRPVLIMARDE